MTKSVKQQGIITEQKNKQPKPLSASTIMKNLINRSSVQETIRNSLGENAGAFTASVIDLYGSDNLLQQCNPADVIAEVLKAVSLKLPINKQLGFAYIVPFRDKVRGPMPTFMLGYKGLIQLAQRSGAYKHINAGEVYEGELKSINKLTGEIDLTGEKTSNKIIGYFAYIETVAGFSKCIYWEKEKVEAHAKRYSRAYSKAGTLWHTDFGDMAQKTLLRNLLSKWGIMSVDLATAVSSDGEYAGDIEESEDNKEPDIVDAEVKVK